METSTKLSGSATSTPGLKTKMSAADALPAYRWVVLFVTWTAFLLSYVDRVAWSTVAAPVGHSLGLSVSMLGAFITAFYIGYVAANLVGGFLTDTFGGRLMLTFALVPLGIATFFFSYTHSLTSGIAIQLAMGVAAGADYSAGVKILTAWFGKEKGKAMGIYTTATSLAVVIANATVPLMSQQYSWETAFRILGGITLCWALVSFLLLRDNPLRVPYVAITRTEIRSLIKNKNLIFLALAGLGGLWGTVGYGAWSNALMTKHYGISPIVAGSIAAWFGVGAVLAKPTLGWISDLNERLRNPMSIACLAGFAMLLLVFGQCSTTAQFYLLAPILGAFAFGYTPLLMAEITHTSGNKSAGAAAGLTNAVWQLGSAMSPLMVGLVYGQTKSFSLALVTLAVGPIFAAVLLLFLRPVKNMPSI
ncbi:MAG: transporter [Herbaspirillum sp.]|jgi:sugar phosphate permease|nr:transporter [Herbaspirillum sp.]